MGKKTAPWVWLWPAAGRRRHFTKEPVLQRFLANSFKKQQGSLSLHWPYAYLHLSSIASQNSPAHHHGTALARDSESRIRNNKWADFFFSPLPRNVSSLKAPTALNFASMQSLKQNFSPLSQTASLPAMGRCCFPLFCLKSTQNQCRRVTLMYLRSPSPIFLVCPLQTCFAKTYSNTP